MFLALSLRLSSESKKTGIYAASLSRSLAGKLLALIIVVHVAGLGLTQSALAASEALRACTQRYADWIRHRDSRLRPLASSAAAEGLEPAYCAPNLQDVAHLKTALFALDGACPALVADEKSRIVAIIAQNLRMLNRVPVCSPTVSSATAADDRPTTVEATQTSTLPVETARPSGVQAPAPEPWKTVSTPSTGGAQKSPAVKAPPRAPAKRQDAATEDTARKVGETKKPSRALESGAPSGRSLSSPSADTLSAADKVDAPPDALLAYAQPAPKQSASPVVAGAAASSDDECLVVRRRSTESYLIDLSRCPTRPVLAAIEIYRPGSPARCVRRAFSSDVAVAGHGSEAPQINFQCITGSADCTLEVLRRMFPECADG